MKHSAPAHEIVDGRPHFSCGQVAVNATSLHFMHYNFVRIHQTLRVTPAMAAGVTDTLWEIEDIARLTG